MAEAGVDAFVRDFVEPLVLGGRVVVDGIITPSVVAGWMRSPHPDATRLARVCSSVRGRLARLGPGGDVDTLPVDAFALAAVWNNLLAVTHPEASARRPLRRFARRACLALLEWVGVPGARGEVALRHGVLARLGELGRVDTHVEFWAGYADFLGVSPPAALVALPSLRRVRESKKRVDLFGLLGALVTPGRGDTDDAELVDVARAAMAASPLTDVLLADRPAPWTFRWTPSHLGALADGSVRGAAQRAVLARGAATVRALEQATLAAMRIAPPREVARTLLRFHLEMLAFDALGSRGVGSTPASSTVAQPLAMDAYVRLGPAAAAAWTGVSVDDLTRVLPAETSRTPLKNTPSAPLLQGAGLMEEPVL